MFVNGNACVGQKVPVGGVGPFWEEKNRMAVIDGGGGRVSSPSDSFSHGRSLKGRVGN